MSHDKHNAENHGAKLRDHEQTHGPYWKRAHRDWRLWVVVVLMIGLIFVYVMTDNLSLKPGRRPGEPMPAVVGP